MTELEARLQENLDDDATWAVYGDWLLEQGDVRGTLVELERRPKVAKIEQQIGALVAEHQVSWRADLPAEVDVIGWRHGFVTGVAVPWTDDAVTLANELVGLPALRFARTLRFTTRTKRDDDEDSDDEDLDDDLNYEDGPPLLEAAQLAQLALGRLTALELPYLRIGDPGAQALASSPSVAQLHVLDLRYAAIGDDGIAALAPRLGPVRRLCLQRNQIGAAGAAALACAQLPQLVELDLRYNTLGPEGAAALASAPFLGQLRRLDLYRTDVTAEGVAALASSALPPALRCYWRGL